MGIPSTTAFQRTLTSASPSPFDSPALMRSWTSSPGKAPVVSYLRKTSVAHTDNFESKLSATDHRWLSSLAPFDFTITYRAEKVNGDADGLSCMPHLKDPDAKPVPDEDYIKPFLARLSSSTEVACNFCSQETFLLPFRTHFVNL